MDRGDDHRIGIQELALVRIVHEATPAFCDLFGLRPNKVPTKTIECLCFAKQVMNSDRGCGTEWLNDCVLVSRADFGMVGLNRGLVSDPAAPFGVMKQSGIGREGAHEGLMDFLETQYVSVNW